MKKKIGVLVSGRGTNLQAIIDAIEKKELDAEISVVISNKSDAFALERAKKHCIPSVVISHKDFDKREDFEKELVNALEKSGVDFIVLAGFMRILSPFFINKYKNRIINIHPALLPSFPGVNAQKQALHYGVKITGCSVHFVDEGVDSGPIILQCAVPVFDNDDEHSLSKRILKEEHKLLIKSLKLLIEDKIVIQGRRVICKGEF